MKGQAIDVRLADVPLVQLRNAALSLGLGEGSVFIQPPTSCTSTPAECAPGHLTGSSGDSSFRLEPEATAAVGSLGESLRVRGLLHATRRLRSILSEAQPLHTINPQVGRYQR